MSVIDVDHEFERSTMTNNNNSRQNNSRSEDNNNLHKVAIPKSWLNNLKKTKKKEEYLKELDLLHNPPFPKNPIKKYKFELDPFQKTAISCLDREESVMVSAHTSSGKTAVAEYAIAQAFKTQSRVVYTSPIKALSNQKYRELKEEFGDVGLITGDVTLDTNSTCLVMTTEILRNMLYRGSEINREVKYIIFDEIHYLQDSSRGVVWEETIVLSPHNAKFVFLSATIPNAFEFAEWVAETHSQPCHVVYTDKRPIPLRHFLFPIKGDGLYLVVDKNKSFSEENFQKCISHLESQSTLKMDPKTGFAISKRQQTMMSGKDDMRNVINLLMKKNFGPVIVFSFSRKECESKAILFQSENFNTSEQSNLVEIIFKKAVESLEKEDQDLPQIQLILPILKRGIAIHHSGLFPIIKEVIEILFQEGLIKVLFATETFSMGLNMPAKTVVFNGIVKYDGVENREIVAGEYIQMSGRAGRRGTDKIGNVILMIQNNANPEKIRSLFSGEPNKLKSSFNLNYNMLLRLLRFEDVNLDHILEKSFWKFQNDKKLPDYENKIEQLNEQIGKINLNIDPEDEKIISQYYQSLQQKEIISEKMKKIRNKPLYVLPFLKPGRLIKVKNTKKKICEWGVVLEFHEKRTRKNFNIRNRGKGQKRNNEQISNSEKIELQKKPADQVSIVTIIPQGYSLGKKTQKLKTINVSGGGNNQEIEKETHDLPHQRLRFLCTDVEEISTIIIKINPKYINQKEHKNIGKALMQIEKIYQDQIPLLDPVADMKIKEKDFLKYHKQILILNSILFKNEKIMKSEKYQNTLKFYDQKEKLKDELNENLNKYRQSKNLIMENKLKNMIKVMKRLSYISQTDDLIQSKGRIACEISSGDEIMLTEMIFSGIFSELNISQIAAITSCFVESPRIEDLELSKQASGLFEIITKLATKIGKLYVEYQLIDDLQDYLKSFTPSLMDIVFEWSKGASFLEISQMTELFEGGIVRTFRRLDELLRQLCNAAKTIGNTELEIKFSKASSLLKRNIIFASSLYL
ncbi:exosome RNA helicase mtr4 [Anaeramoeba flamelloides]|uniref:Exosome RNA helicase mtr4 n=1 Tax=Anaeramoeba flamelloides TaxID=1746091 RepID=A0AAV8ACA6_9EUKA|nr:exosome RNA helicase mtr4 [Anaeramoeba flamelloides]